MAIESAAIPFSSELVMPLAGWLLIEDRGVSYGWCCWPGFYGALGNLLGSWLAYGVSLTGGRLPLRKDGRYILVTQEGG